MDVELNLATLKDILDELRLRGYIFMFAADVDGQDTCKVCFGTDDLIQPIRLASEILDTVLDILKKNNIDDIVTKTLNIVLLQIDLLFNDGEQSPQEIQ